MDACKLFRERLKEEYPELLDAADEQIESIETKIPTKKRKWIEEPDSSDFSFNFFGS